MTRANDLKRRRASFDGDAHSRNGTRAVVVRADARSNGSGGNVAENGHEETKTNEGVESESVTDPHGEERKSEGGDDDDDKEETKQRGEGEDSGDGASGSDSEEDDVLVVLELTDFKNHPIFEDHRSITIEGIDTASPMLRIGEYTLHGQLEETVGTNFFYDTKNRTEQNHYQYVGQTTKKIKFSISPPEQ